MPQVRGLRVVSLVMTILLAEILSISGIGILLVVDSYMRVKQVGFSRYLEEERAMAGVDLMGHLEQRCCKVVELEDR